MNYNDASLVITPNGFKAGKLYAVKGADMVVTRATSATRVNANGIIETVGANVPRIDYSGGGCPSILVEPQRTNSLLNSATVANQTINVTAVPHTISFYGSGTITLSGTHSATVVGLGTARKTYTFTPTAGNLVLTVSGTCTMGQLEAGSYATSYIPTTSASVTRNADVISKTGISDLIGQTEGTLFLDYILTSNIAFPVDFELNSDNIGTNNVTIYHNGNLAGVTIRSGGSIIFTALSSALTLNSRNKIALAYKQNNFVAYLNGVQFASQTSGNVPLILSNFRVSDGGRNYKINLGSIWKTRLTNAELATLTTL
jgi:hypothetical protein